MDPSTQGQKKPWYQSLKDAVCDRPPLMYAMMVVLAIFIIVWLWNLISKEAMTGHPGSLRGHSPTSNYYTGSNNPKWHHGGRDAGSNASLTSGHFDGSDWRSLSGGKFSSGVTPNYDMLARADPSSCHPHTEGLTGAGPVLPAGASPYHSAQSVKQAGYLTLGQDDGLCGLSCSQWDPLAQTEAEALAYAGALDHATPGEAALVSNAGGGLTEAQLQGLLG